MVLATAGLAAVAGCTVPSNAPAAYDEAVRDFFLEGCTGDVPETDGTTTTLASADACGCAFDVYVELVPYDDDARTAVDDAGELVYAGYPAEAPTFKDLDKDPVDDSAKWDALPGEVRTALDGCGDGSATSGEPSESGDGGSTAGEPSDAVEEGSTSDAAP